MHKQGFGGLVQCPYNKSHMVKPSILARHIYKCSKQYPDVKLAVCPYNSTHHMPESEMKEHLTTCEGYLSVQQYKYTIVSNTDINRTVANEPKLELNNEGPSTKTETAEEECWDDFQYKPYDPFEHCLANNIPLRHKGGPRSMMEEQFLKKKKAAEASREVVEKVEDGGQPVDREESKEGVASERKYQWLYNANRTEASDSHDDKHTFEQSQCGSTKGWQSRNHRAVPYDNSQTTPRQPQRRPSDAYNQYPDDRARPNQYHHQYRGKQSSQYQRYDGGPYRSTQRTSQQGHTSEAQDCNDFNFPSSSGNQHPNRRQQYGDYYNEGHWREDR